MTNPIKLYAIKLCTGEHGNPSFDTCGEKLDNGFQYVGIRLHQTQESAQADVDSEAHMAWIHATAESDDPDFITSEQLEAEKGLVVEIQLHADGKIVDTSGFDLAEYIGQSIDQTRQQVLKNLMEYYEDKSPRQIKERSYANYGPGF